VPPCGVGGCADLQAGGGSGPLEVEAVPGAGAPGVPPDHLQDPEGGLTPVPVLLILEFVVHRGGGGSCGRFRGGLSGWVDFGLGP